MIPKPASHPTEPTQGHLVFLTWGLGASSWRGIHSQSARPSPSCGLMVASVAITIWDVFVATAGQSPLQSDKLLNDCGDVQEPACLQVAHWASDYGSTLICLICSHLTQAGSAQRVRSG